MRVALFGTSLYNRYRSKGIAVEKALVFELGAESRGCNLGSKARSLALMSEHCSVNGVEI